jgi:hypothetical protein
MVVQAPGFAGGDRTSLDLPAPQQQLLERLHATGKPVILVLVERLGDERELGRRPPAGHHRGLVSRRRRAVRRWRS